jgi:hypothetical protein
VSIRGRSLHCTIRKALLRTPGLGFRPRRCGRTDLLRRSSKSSRKATGPSGRPRSVAWRKRSANAAPRSPSSSTFRQVSGLCRSFHKASLVGYPRARARCVRPHLTSATPRRNLSCPLARGFVPHSRVCFKGGIHRASRSDSGLARVAPLAASECESSEM